MSHSIVDYENLMDTSFNDSNISVRTSVRPRWERKKKQQLGLGDPDHHHHRTPLSNTTANAVSSAVAAGSSNNSSLGDRFIPNRAGMNMELSKHLIRSSTTSADSFASVSGDSELPNQSGAQKAVSDAKKEMYASNLSSALLGVDDVKGNRILSYQEKAPAPKGDTVNNLNILYSVSAAGTAPSGKASNPKLVTRHIPNTPSRILDAPDLMDDYYLNLLSWSDTNVLAVALSQTVYLWNAATGDITELCTFDEGPNAHISSVAWVQQGGAHIAVGTSNGKTQLWDVTQTKKLRSMDGHSDRVSSLAWNRHVLSSGSRDTTIINHDVRVARHGIATLSIHEQEVCGLTWSPDGDILASGGNDNLLCLWDTAASSHSAPRFRFTDHQAAVKALAWSPHERHLLATGAGTADRTIKFWNTQTGALLNSIDTGSQVCALQWNPFEKEILSSHGYARNQLCLWKYPSMAKIKEFEGHTSRVLHLAVSPDGGNVVSAAGDETLRFWDIFVPIKKRKTAATHEFGVKTGTVSGRGPMSGSTSNSWTAQIR